MTLKAYINRTDLLEAQERHGAMQRMVLKARVVGLTNVDHTLLASALETAGIPAFGTAPIPLLVAELAASRSDPANAADIIDALVIINTSASTDADSVKITKRLLDQLGNRAKYIARQETGGDGDSTRVVIFIEHIGRFAELNKSDGVLIKGIKNLLDEVVKINPAQSIQNSIRTQKALLGG